MSNSQFGNLIHFSPKETKELPKINLGQTTGGQTYDENWLQDIIFRHPNSLPIQELDSSFGPLIPVCREMESGAGPIDLVYINPNGMLTLVECKLWKNPEARREVVGQILDYAKELSGWRYEDLQREVARSLKKPGNALYDLVKEHHDINEATFVDNTTSYLKEGKFLLLILGDGIRQGVEKITEYIKGHAGMHFTFGLVEAAVYPLPNGELILQPRVLAKTMTVERYTVRLVDSDMALETEQEGLIDDEVNEIQADHKAFWQDYLKKLDLDDVAQPLPNASTQANIWLMMPQTKNHVWINVFRAMSKDMIGVFLRFQKDSNIAKTVYDSLEEQRDALEAELGMEDIIWEHQRGGARIVVKQKLDGKMNRDEQIKWLADTTNRFVNVFRHRIEKIGEEINKNMN